MGNRVAICVMVSNKDFKLLKHAAREIGEGVVHFFLVLYINGTSQWRNVSGEMYQDALCTSQPEIMTRVCKTNLRPQDW